MEMKWKHNSFGRRLKSMLAVDFRRMFTMRLLYIMLGICLAMPVLTLVMTTTMSGGDTAGSQMGVETVMDSGNAKGHTRGAGRQTGGGAAPEGFTNAWQAIGSVSGEGSAMNMNLMSMCNINMLYFFIAVLVCLFVSEDFKSGYAKNLFTVCPKKGDYVIP